MPVVRINDATFSDLKTISTWLGTKTPSETIDRIVKDAMESLDLAREDEADATPVANGSVITFETTPGLSFTKPISAKINEKSQPNPRWSTLLLNMIEQVKAKGFEGERLVCELGVPAKAIRFDEEGFTFYPSLGISVQGQSAADAWKEIDRLAKKWRIPVAVEFMWRQNPKAQYPGKTGVLRSGN